MKHWLISLFTVSSLALITIVIIAYGRGFRFNPHAGEVTATGLLNATSEPDGAQVYIDGSLKTATNSTLNLPPGTYQVKLVKEGYLPWEKKMSIYAEVVAQTEAVLFPANPGLAPLTTFGITNPAVSPDGSAIAFLKRKPPTATSAAATPPAASGGIFVLNLEDRPLSFSRNPRQIAAGDQFSSRNSPASISLIWSPDANQILAIFTNSATEKQTAYLLDSSTLNTNPRPVPSAEEIRALWQEQTKLKRQNQIRSLPPPLIPVATSAAAIVSFSPDESKILYRARRAATIPQIITPPLIGTNPTPETRTIKSGNLYVYDLKEDRNYFIGKAAKYQNSPGSPDLPNHPNFSLRWFPTSRHLLFIEDSKIKIMEYDGSNLTTLYAGPFSDNFVVPWPNGSKLVILTTLNPDAAATLNLYAVKLR